MSVITLIKGTLSAIVKRQSGLAYIRKAVLESPCYIKSGTRFASSSLGKYSYISRNCSFFATDIGKFCSIADHCNCGMPEHRMECASTSQAFLKGKNCLRTDFGVLEHPKYKRTTIGNDVWIGTNVTIKAGVKIGHGAVIGMGSVVVKDIPDYAIAVGCPARVVRYRFEEETRKKLLESAWWDMDEKDIRRLAGAFESPNELLAKLGEMNNEE